MDLTEKEEKAKSENAEIESCEINNSMIQAKKIKDKILFKILREAISQEDVKECIDVFDFFLLKNLKPNEQVRILVNAQAVKIPVLKIKWTIVKSFQSHFQSNLKSYLAHLSKCAVILNDIFLAKTFQPIVFLVINDSKRIQITHSLIKGQEFLAN
jgi:hypothetical protein